MPGKPVPRFGNPSVPLARRNVLRQASLMLWCHGNLDLFWKRPNNLKADESNVDMTDGIAVQWKLAQLAAGLIGWLTDRRRTCE
jgi:hypothetical protein